MPNTHDKGHFSTLIVQTHRAHTRVEGVDVF